MSRSFEDRLRISLGASRLLFALLVFMHLGAAVALLATPMPVLPRLALLLAAGVNLYRSARLHALRTAPSAIVELELGEACAVRLRGNGDWRECDVLTRAVHPWAVVLRLRLRDERLARSLVILPDAVDGDWLRRLRVRLNLAL